ncbi:hypothetical protein [Phenylobacterium sp.]|uniref:hypothetical protein n=1 Tax=Phenylobacterium sp. TaxID=1871053 RepID=UPI002C9C50C6|nr:hypothetical protein [Phenylobacterium sp.]HVI32801.1 hypothetical protein [Phenylobacterium sp.]
MKKVAAAAPAVRKATAATAPKAVVRKTPAKSAAGEHARAAVSGAVDEFTLGAADRVLSAGEALLDGGVQGFGDRYTAEMRQRRAEDSYDSAHHGAARTVGRAVGLVGGVAATGGVASAGRVALSRLPQAAKLITAVHKAPRLKVGVDPLGLGRLAAGAGATGGVTAQVVQDVATGRPSSPQQYGAAALGGAVGGVATLRYGPMHGGAIGGASEAAASDMAAGRMPSADRAIGAAHGGALLGKVGDVAGTYRTAALPAHLKGEVGEALSYAKTLARGKKPNVSKDKVGVGGGKFSKPDQKIGDDFLEAKMGPHANLTRNQRLLQAKLNREGKKLLIDAWQFRDVGKAAGILASPLGGVWVNEEGTRWPGR